MTKDHKNLEINIVDKLRKVFFSDVYTYFFLIGCLGLILFVLASGKSALLVRLLTISFFAFQNYLLLDSMKKDKEHLSTFPVFVVNNKSDESRFVIVVSFLVHYSVIIFMGVVEFSWRMPN